MNDPTPNPSSMPFTSQTTRRLLDESAWLERLARRLVRDPGLAQEAVQDTLVAASEREQRGEGPAPRGWLAKVLRNGLRQGLRARGRRAVHEELAAPDGSTTERSALDIVSRLEVQRLLVEAVQDLHEPYRTAIALRFLEDLPPREVARRTEAPVKTVKTRIERGLELLRRRLDTRTGGRERWLSALAPLGTHFGVPGLSLTTSGVLTMGLGWKLAGGAALTALVWFGVHVGDEGAIGEPVGPERAVAEAETVDAVEPPAPEPVEPIVVDATRERVVTAKNESKPSEAVAAVPTFEGFVVDLQGRPVGGLRVGHVSTATGIWLRTEEETFSDAAGRFELPVITERGRLVAAGKGFATLEPASYAGILPPEAPTIVVGPERHYAGLVLDENEEPLAGAELEIHLPEEVAKKLRDGALSGVAAVQVSESGAGGGFTFDPVGHVPGLRMRVRRDGFVEAMLELPDSSDDQLVVSPPASTGGRGSARRTRLRSRRPAGRRGLRGGRRSSGSYPDSGGSYR